MRQPFLFIDRGHGWENLTGHESGVCALTDFTVDWGTDEPTTQPEVNVLKFRLLDRTGTVAGNSSSLAGAKVWIQLTRMPLWADLNAEEKWQDNDTTWRDFHLCHVPDPTLPPDPTALTIFKGTMSTGGTIEQLSDGRYMLNLYANSTLVRASRTTHQGPVSSDPALAGYHWAVPAGQRIDEIQRRLESLGCPPLSDATVHWLKGRNLDLAPYDTSSFPDLTTVLYGIAAADPELPLYYETHEHGSETIEAVHAGAKAFITLHANGTLTVTCAGHTEQVVSGGDITVDSHTLTLPDPVSQVIIKGKKVEWQDSEQHLTFSDDEIHLSDRGRLPTNLKETIASVSAETDAIITDASEGHYKGKVWQPTEGQREQWADWLQAASLRLRPVKITASSRFIDIDDFEQQLQPSASLWAFVSNRYTKLLSDDGSPATSGAWLATGGTLTFTWQGNEPTLSNEISIHPLPMIPPTMSHWQDLTPITLPWTALPITWGEFSQITYFQQ